MTHVQGGQKSCTFFNTPYLWNRSRKNKMDFTKLFPEFLEIKIVAIFIQLLNIFLLIMPKMANFDGFNLSYFLQL